MNIFFWFWRGRILLILFLSYYMAALDPFDSTMIEDLNRELKRHCKPLTLYYKYKDGSRDIGLSYGGEPVSYILLRK